MAVEVRGRTHKWSLESSINELGQLAKTAGATIVGEVTQRMAKSSGAYYLGSGKLQELLANPSDPGNLPRDIIQLRS